MTARSLLFLAVWLMAIVLALWLQPGARQLLPVSFSTPAPEAVLPAPVKFRSSALSQGLVFEHRQSTVQLSSLIDTLGPGACVLDVNRDGWMDLLLVGGSGTRRYYGKAAWWQAATGERLFVNLGHGRGFVDQTAAFLPEAPAFTSFGCAVADLNQDGLEDLLVYGLGNPRFYQRTAAGFEMTDIGLSLPANEVTSGAVFLDANLDGKLDVYLTRFVSFEQGQRVFERFSGYAVSHDSPFDATLFDAIPNVLLLNLGGFQFEDRTAEYGVANTQGRSLGAKALDLDADGDEDLLVLNDHGTPNRVLLNNKGQHFQSTSRYPALMLSGSRDVSVLDSDHFFFSRGSGAYPALIKAGEDAGLRSPNWLAMSSWGVATGDFNNDGYADLFVANGLARPDTDAALVPVGQDTSLLLGSASGFHAASSMHERLGSSRGAVTLDYDNNGLPDILVMNNNGSLALHTNESTVSPWLMVDLIVPAVERSRTRVSLKLGDKTLSQKAGFRQGFLSQSDARLHFSLGDHQAVDQLTVRWADGRETKFQNVAAGQVLRIGKTGIESPLPVTLEQMQPAQNLGILEARMRDEDALTRLAAIQEVRDSEYDLAVDWLIAALEDEDPQIRCAAADTFAAWFEEEEAAIRRKYLAIKPLIKALDGDQITARCAARALGAAERKRPVPEMLRVLDRTADTNLIAEITRSLGLIRDDRATATLLEFIVSHPEPNVVAASLIALERLGQGDLAEKKLSARSTLMQLQAYSELLVSKDTAVINRERILQHLNDIAAKPLVAETRLALVDALGKSGVTRYATELKSWLQEEDQALREKVTEALARLEGRLPAAALTGSLPHLTSLLQGVVRRLTAKEILALRDLGVAQSLLLPYVDSLPRGQLDTLMTEVLHRLPEDELLPWLARCRDAAGAPIGGHGFLALPTSLMGDNAAIGCFLYSYVNRTKSAGDPLATRITIKRAMREMTSEQQTHFRQQLAKFDDFYAQP